MSNLNGFPALSWPEGSDKRVIKPPCHCLLERSCEAHTAPYHARISYRDPATRILLFKR